MSDTLKMIPAKIEKSAASSEGFFAELFAKISLLSKKCALEVRCESC